MMFEDKVVIQERNDEYNFLLTNEFYCALYLKDTYTYREFEEILIEYGIENYYFSKYLPYSKVFLKDEGDYLLYLLIKENDIVYQVDIL